MVPCKLCNSETELVRLSSTAGHYKCPKCGNLNIYHHEDVNEFQKKASQVVVRKEEEADSVREIPVLLQGEN